MGLGTEIEAGTFWGIAGGIIIAAGGWAAKVFSAKKMEQNNITAHDYKSAGAANERLFNVLMERLDKCESKHAAAEAANELLQNQLNRALNQMQQTTYTVKLLYNYMEQNKIPVPYNYFPDSEGLVPLKNKGVSNGVE